MPNEFGNKIKQKRQQLGYSLRKVCASVLGEKGEPISVSYLNDIEQGYRNPPGGKIVVQLAEVLQMDSHELLTLAGKVDPFIENVASEAEVAILYRRIAEQYKENPEILKKLTQKLDEERDKKK